MKAGMHDKASATRVAGRILANRGEPAFLSPKNAPPVAPMRATTAKSNQVRKAISWVLTIKNQATALEFIR